MDQPKQIFKPVNFENPVFKTLLARKFQVREKHLKYFVLPVEGDKITLGNIIYRITYIRQSPFRFTAEPVAILSDEEAESGEINTGTKTEDNNPTNPSAKEE